MEIINTSYAVLSNFEVLQTLRNIKDTKNKHGLRNLATIMYETIRFLEDGPSKTQTQENILAYLDAIKPYKLSKEESLMLVNDPPTTPLHIQLLVEDSEERLSEEEVQQLLEITRKWLLPPEYEDELE